MSPKISPTRRALVGVAAGASLCIVACASMLGAACQTPAERRAERGRIEPDREPAVRRPERPWPKYSSKPGKKAFAAWALKCFQRGLAHNGAVFRAGGVLVVRWWADRRGDLLRLHIDRDTFRGWEVDKAGTSFAECVVGAARRATKTIWSKQDVVALRLSGPGAEDKPHPSTDGGAARARADAGRGGGDGSTGGGS